MEYAEHTLGSLAVFRAKRSEGEAEALWRETSFFSPLHLLSHQVVLREEAQSNQPPIPLWTTRSFPDPTPTPTEILADQMKGIERVLDSLRPEFGSWLHRSLAKVAWANHFLQRW